MLLDLFNDPQRNLILFSMVSGSPILRLKSPRQCSEFAVSSELNGALTPPKSLHVQQQGNNEG